jgi:hypothetical protein
MKNKTWTFHGNAHNEDHSAHTKALNEHTAALRSAEELNRLGFWQKLKVKIFGKQEKK